MTSSTRTSPALPRSVEGFRRGVGASEGIDNRRTEPVPIYPADKRAVLTLSTFLTGRTVEKLHQVSTSPSHSHESDKAHTRHPSHLP